MTKDEGEKRMGWDDNGDEGRIMLMIAYVMRKRMGEMRDKEEGVGG